MIGVIIAFGFGSLLERPEILLHAIKWAGIAYLLWLGVQAIRHARSIAETPSEWAPVEPIWRAVRTGTFVGLTNPKSFVLFTAIVTRREIQPPPTASTQAVDYRSGR
ncbi:threonine/homoserine/homoserine lactone efflux protein [Rhodococcus sp. OAS809]